MPVVRDAPQIVLGAGDHLDAALKKFARKAEPVRAELKRRREAPARSARRKAKRHRALTRYRKEHLDHGRP